MIFLLVYFHSRWISFCLHFLFGKITTQRHRISPPKVTGNQRPSSFPDPRQGHLRLSGRVVSMSTSLLTLRSRSPQSALEASQTSARAKPVWGPLLSGVGGCAQLTGGGDKAVTWWLRVPPTALQRQGSVTGVHAPNRRCACLVFTFRLSWRSSLFSPCRCFPEGSRRCSPRNDLSSNPLWGILCLPLWPTATWKPSLFTRNWSGHNVAGNRRETVFPRWQDLLSYFLLTSSRQHKW